MPTKVKELVAQLEADGWFLVRTKGSHRQFHHPTKRGTVTAAGKPSLDVPPRNLGQRPAAGRPSEVRSGWTTS
jgi:predicted RNA binding protein YcfA (HicA-like mRNA interferase family)